MIPSAACARGLPIPGDTQISARGLRCLWSIPDVLGHGHLERAVLVAQIVTMFTEEVPRLSKPDKSLIMGDALCAWSDWNRAD